MDIEKLSSCCGAIMNSEYADRLICPECKEHCGIETVEHEMEKCSNPKCGKPISLGVFKYSINSWMRKALCIPCQIEFAKEKGKSEIKPEYKKKTVFERMDEIEDQKFSWGAPRGQ